MVRPAPFVEHCLDLFQPLGPVSWRRMFGGWGFWMGGDFFALVAGERLFLKADEETRPLFEAQGAEPFVYARRDRPGRSGGRDVSLSYFSAPDAALDDPESMLPWARRAVEAARRARARRARRPASAGEARRARAGRRR